jgi:hypothetical protein
MLRTLRPAVHFIHGEKSPISFLAIRKTRLESCRTCPRGSGGVEIGRVKETLLPTGHFLPFVLWSETGKAIAGYLAVEMTEWNKADTKRLGAWKILSFEEKQTMDDEYF